MTSGDKKSGADKQRKQGDESVQPAWADGLKQLYDSVVDEPLPSNLEHLLSQLDIDSDEQSPHPGQN